MSVIVDSSVWIEYFRNRNNTAKLDFLIDENLVVINELILAELVPSLKIRNQKDIIALLYDVAKLPLVINWDEIIEFQFKCLKNGLNGVGISDLIIAQNAKQNHCEIYSFDNHFRILTDILEVRMME